MKRSRASRSRPSPHSSTRSVAGSRSRLAIEMKTERVTAVGDPRTARATMAWFLRSRPTCRTLTGAATRRSAGGVKAASVATRTWASPARAASAEARARASPMSAVAGVATIAARAARTRPMSVVALATTRGVGPAATTLTRPPDGRSRSASRASALAASRREGATSVEAMLAEASTTSTRSRASVAGRSANGCAATRARRMTRRSWRRSRNERRRRCHGALAWRSSPKRCQRRVELTVRSVRRSLSIQKATTSGRKARPRRARGAANGIAGPP